MARNRRRQKRILKVTEDFDTATNTETDLLGQHGNEGGV